MLWSVVMRILLTFLLMIVVTSCDDSGGNGDADTSSGDADTDGTESDADVPVVDADRESEPDSDLEEDADEEVDAEVDEDEEPELPLECGYPESGYGRILGRPLMPFRLWTCEGEETNLPRLWCGNSATIVHLVVAWCGSCYSNTHDLMTQVLPDLEGEGVGMIEIVLEDDPDEVADLELCGWWRDYLDPPITTHVPADGVLVDPLHEFLHTEAMPLTIVLDAEGVIRIWQPAFIPWDMADQIREIL